MASERMTWEEMVNTYPDVWVAIRNPEKDGPNIISGEIHAIITDEDICDYEDAHFGEGLVFRRTTEDDWNGIIRTQIISATA